MAHSSGYTHPPAQPPFWENERKCYLRTWDLFLAMAATASSCVSKCTSASPVAFPLELYSMVTLTGFRGAKNYQRQQKHTCMHNKPIQIAYFTQLSSTDMEIKDIELRNYWSIMWSQLSIVGFGSFKKAHYLLHNAKTIFRNRFPHIGLFPNTET